MFEDTNIIVVLSLLTIVMAILTLITGDIGAFVLYIIGLAITTLVMIVGEILK